MKRGRPEDGQGDIIFPDPVSPFEEMPDWDHERWPVQHLYTFDEIVVVEDPHGYRWHLPHGPTGTDYTERSAFNTAKKVVRHADPILHYGETINAARSWGNNATTVPRFVYDPGKAVRKMCVRWLAIVATACLAELKSRAPKVWAKVMLSGQDDPVQ